MTLPRFASLAALTLVLAAPATGLPPASAAPLQEARSGRPALEHYNLEKNRLALSGYDPVAYFPVGGGKARKGSKSFEHVHRGVRYRFASEAHRKLFLQSPERFEPAFGGWCAYAMASDDRVEVDPESFLIEQGRLLVFYDGLFADTRKSWRKAGPDELRPQAERHWTKLSGEAAPRDLKHFNLERDLALAGYDPVSYFEEGGGKPRKGEQELSAAHDGVTYRFASAANRKRFLAQPARFEPHYGGWCAWAMASGRKVRVDPEAFAQGPEGLYVFYDKSKRDAWRAKRASFVERADRAWEGLHAKK